MLPPYAIYYYVSWFPIVLFPNCVPTAFTNPRYLTVKKWCDWDEEAVQKSSPDHAGPIFEQGQRESI